jgi:signal transduction histidine kinase
MGTGRADTRTRRGNLAEQLLALAASLQGLSPDDALDHVTNRLARHDVTFALLTELPDRGRLRVERSTLALEKDVWGGALALPLLAGVPNRGQPVVLPSVADVFSEPGGKRSLWRGRGDAPLIVAPLRVDGRSALLCLVAKDLGEQQRLAAWALALQLGSAISRSDDDRAAKPDEPPAESGDGLFHELTRRLSYTLNRDEALLGALEVLAPAVSFAYGAAIICQDGGDSTTLYAGATLPREAASSAAAAGLDAFFRLTGQRHPDCEKPPFEVVELSGAAGGRPSPRASALDAPLVVDGDVVGLLRIVSGAEPFDRAAERTFYTVANQVSLALERVDAQRKAERAQLASLVESLSDGIILCDAGLRVTSLNHAARELLGALREVDAEEGAVLTNAGLTRLAQEALGRGAATPMQQLDATAGDRRYLAAMAAPLAGSQEGSAAVIILRDVTEERLMQERLLQSEKMASVGQLVSGVAHELNNPLTGIGGFAQVLLSRDLDDTMRRQVETIANEADRASKIVQNLLSFARRKKTHKELANLNALIERVLELRSYDLRVKNIDVQLDLAELPDTLVDADQIQQVFLNVIINAEQAILSAGDRGTLTVRSRAEGDAIHLTIRDDGPGLADATLRRIFDPFFTTKQAGEGTGLGLTISYGIIDDHGGRIWAESAPKRGTTFHIELPVVRDDARAPQPRGTTEAEPAVTGRSILVVDDEESIQRLLGTILAMDGHQVDVARNGLDALRQISRRRYDAVITDIKMPDMDGRALYQELLATDRSLAERTIFITGDTVSPETRIFLQEVDNPCLAKPFRVREVRETLEGLLAARV